MAGMNWVAEREEWLAEWDDAICLKTLDFRGNSDTRSFGAADAGDVFFSEVVEVGASCLICRASGAIVEVFDISPAARRLASWRVLLPSPVARDIGISFSRDAAGAHVSLMLLTRALAIHVVDVLLPRLDRSSSSYQVPELREGPSSQCGGGLLTSTPSSFCALGRELAAVGCFSGELHIVRLLRDGGHASFELASAKLLQRLVGGLFRPQQPAVIAMAAAGTGSGSGLLLLSYAASGRLQLWEVSERHGHLIASSDTVADSGSASGLSGTASAYIRISETPTRACVVLRSTIYIVDLPSSSRFIAGGALEVREVGAPFSGAAPLLVALSQSTLWGFWSGPSREQLFRFDLEALDVGAWEARAVDASMLQGDDVVADSPLRRIAVEGCAGAVKGAASAHRCVFTLYQQQEVWRGEEDAFDPFRALSRAGVTSEDEEEALERAVRWWAGRALLPGRFSLASVAVALQEVGARPVFGAGERPDATAPHGLRVEVEAHFRRQCGMPPGGPAGGAGGIGDGMSAYQAMANLANTASHFVRTCEAAGRQSRQVCGLGVSSMWAPHAWYPAGDVGVAGSSQAVEGGAGVCPVLLYHGGVSCVRAVHSWPERWWATCHLSRDLSNFERVEIENLLEISDLAEWKLAAVGWFLSQCVGEANMGWALRAMRKDTRVSTLARRLAEDVPKNLEAHVARCAAALGGAALGAAAERLATLMQALCGPAQCQVSVQGNALDALHGTWPGRPSLEDDACCLSDVLRGGIASTEGEHVVTSMSDLALLCAYSAKGGTALHQDPAVWAALSGELDQQLPLFAALHSSMISGVPGACGAWVSNDEAALPLRAADVWASMFRTSADASQVSVRAPLASFRTFQYALQLLRHECWGALREWCAHQEMGPFSSYVAAREWLSLGRTQAALLAFEQAEGAANVLMECFESSEDMKVNTAGPAPVAYFEHVAGLLGARRMHEEEHRFLSKAAHLAADSSAASLGLRQRLWCSLFEKAVALDFLEEACEVLSLIDHFEGHLHTLAQKMRLSGRIDLIMGMPEKLKTCFINNLHEHATLSTPSPGSDSLLCYHHLYALHFSAQEYFKAATIAHSLHSALDQALGQEGAATAAGGSEPDTLAEVASGDCISKASEVPKKRSAEPAADAAAHLDFDAFMADDSGAGDYSSQVWPLLDQQRSALLMLSSALSLTPGQVILVPGKRPRSSGGAITMPGRGGAGGAPRAAPSGAGPSAALQQLLQDAPISWASVPSAGGARGCCTVSVKDVERWLAMAEAKLILCGGASEVTGDSGSAAVAAGAAARRVAELGLLALALRLVKAHGLDAWRCALRPFLALCLDAEKDERAAATLAEHAQGPAQVYMFVRSDAGEPLGVEGSALRGWWQTLEAGLKAASGFSLQSDRLDAAGCRLFSLVASEFLARRPSEALPEFLTKQLSTGPSWVALLRVYMKHGRLEEAVGLVREQLKTSEKQFMSLDSKRLRWTPLRDFPSDLVEQLRNGIDKAADRCDAKGKRPLMTELDKILTQFSSLMADAASKC